MRRYKERLKKMKVDIREVTVPVIPSGHGIGRCMRSLEEFYLNQWLLTAK